MATKNTSTTPAAAERPESSDERFEVARTALLQIAALVEAQAAIASRLIADASIDDINDGVAIEALARQAGWLAEHALLALGCTSMNFGPAEWMLGRRIGVKHG